MEDKYQAAPGFTVISGGQTGADRAGLDWAIDHGLRHGGWCPSGRTCEDGVVPDKYALQETPGSGYLQRTTWNVRDSDATLIFTLDEELDGGSARTAKIAAKLGKPWLHVRPGVGPKYVASFLALHHVKTLNVAGKRASVAPGIEELVHVVLSQSVYV